MDIYPAIDIISGHCVRLAQGDYEQMTVYNPSPMAQAVAFEEQGARWLHVVDLDAAKTGEQQNLKAISEICSQTSLKVQAGGGVRSAKAAQKLMDAGAARVVVGTAAVENPALVAELAAEMPIALGVDLRADKVSTRGWQQAVDVSFAELLLKFSDAPLSAVILTDIAQDGMLSGPNLDLYQAALGISRFPVIASGGVGSLNHIEELASLSSDSSGNTLSGVILGRAIYEGKLTLEQALDV